MCDETASKIAGKPWKLRGSEIEIVHMREVQRLKFKQIAKLVDASISGVHGAYVRGKKQAELQEGAA